ncbi:hypothetical protein GPA22_01940 [Aromatoleum toluvorans]|uniref:Cytochrome c domain-containing protein n=1 Tax=Aromatoleum toluvorans TaxID=92002 RepID=A0ABX1PSS4_9RHOO|nr:hypothetical protein [Aromatoleum toluvorans]NMG42496.1 hypothetical protein [Aromatoleum toluvorans]
MPPRGGRVALGFSLLLLLSPGANAAGAVSFTKDVVGVFKRQCVACHMTGEEQGQLGLAPGLAYAGLVSVASRGSGLPRVAPGEPERSYLVHKLQGTHLDQGGSGERMPMGQEPLAERDIALVRDWIAAGAKNN